MGVFFCEAAGYGAGDGVGVGVAVGADVGVGWRVTRAFGAAAEVLLRALP